MPSPLATIARRYKAFAHPARLRIACMMQVGELCVCQMTAVLRLAPSTVSAHLAELRRSSCVAERKEGRWVFYGLTAEGRRWLEVAQRDIEADPHIIRDLALAERLRALGAEELCRVDLDVRRLGIELEGPTS